MIGQIIKQLRNEHSITQQHLAKLLNVNQRTISNWENGIARPSLEMTKEISKIFNVCADYLLEISNSPKPTYPDIILSNNNKEMSFWYVEKTDRLLESLSILVDNINAEKGNIHKDNFNNLKLILNSITLNAVKLFATSAGLKNCEYDKDVELINKFGLNGYNTFKMKYNVTNEDMNNLIYFEKHKDGKKD